MLQNFKVVFLSLLAYAIYVLIAITVSGRLDRFYEERVAQEDASLKVGGLPKSPQEVAKAYQPIVLANPSQELGQPQRVLFEVIDPDKDTLGLTYRFEWSEEIRPGFFWQSWFGYFYYGLSRKDYSYVQFKVARKSGRILEMLYEAPSPSDQPFQHNLIRYRRSGQGWQQRTEPQGSNPTDWSPAKWPEKPIFFVQNGKHELLFAPPKDPNASQQFFELVRLDKAIYTGQKFARRLQGDYRSEEANANLGVILFAGFIVVIYIYGILKDYMT